MFFFLRDNVHECACMFPQLPGLAHYITVVHHTMHVTCSGQSRQSAENGRAACDRARRVCF